MSRPPKRQRKKDAAAIRRQMRIEAARRRRRNRIAVFTATVVVLAGGGTAIAFLAGGNKKPTPTPLASIAPRPTPVPSVAPVACGAKTPKTAGSKKDTYKAADDEKLQAGNTYLWRLNTSCGRIDIALDIEKSPKTSNSIAFLTRKGYYDGLFFHRIVTDFAEQGGSADGSGIGGPGYQVVEAPPKDMKYVKGVVAMAKAGADPSGASGSQFFIVPGDGAETLPPIYAYAGKVVDGMDVVAKINKVGSAEQGGTPTQRVYIESAEIVGGSGE